MLGVLGPSKRDYFWLGKWKKSSQIIEDEICYNTACYLFYGLNPPWGKSLDTARFLFCLLTKHKLTKKYNLNWFLNIWGRILVLEIQYCTFSDCGSPKKNEEQLETLYLVSAGQGVTKRCRLSRLTNSTLVDEPKCGRGGGGELRGASANEYMYTGAQTKFGDLPPYLTYGA